jgi:cobalamin biosynthesis Mg chelatase CobN
MNTSNPAAISRAAPSTKSDHLRHVSIPSAAIAPSNRNDDTNASSLGRAEAGASTPSTLAGRTSGVLALIVGIMALLALMYLVLIFYRRRTFASEA